MKSFCHPVSSFWVAKDYKWEFTPCFLDSVFIYVPCGFLYLAAVFQFLTSEERREYVFRLPFTRLHLLKILVAVAVFFTAATQLVFNINHERHRVADFELISPIPILIAMVLLVILMEIDRRKGDKNSGIVFIFWLLMSFHGAASLKTTLHLHHHPNRSYPPDRDSRLRLIFACVYFGLSIISFIFSWFPIGPSSSLNESDSKPCPLSNASLLSRVYFWWMNKLTILGHKRSLIIGDVPEQLPSEKVHAVLPKFQAAWEEQLRKAGVAGFSSDAVDIFFTSLSSSSIPNGTLTRSKEMDRSINFPSATPTNPKATTPTHERPSLWMAISKTAWRPTSFAFLMYFLTIPLSLTSPFLVKLLIDFSANPSQPAWLGIFYSFLMLFVLELMSIASSQGFFYMNVAAIRTSKALIAALYRKSLRLSNEARQRFTTGDIINLMAVDTQRINDFVVFLPYAWIIPLQLIVAVALLYQVIGVSSAYSLLVFFVLAPVLLVLVNILKNLQVKMMDVKDKRVDLLSEVLNGIKVVKLYAWECWFASSLTKLRTNELKLIFRSTMAVGSIVTIYFATSFTLQIVAYLTYLARHDTLLPNTAFVASSLLMVIINAMAQIPNIVPQAIQAMTASKRIVNFLVSEEISDGVVDRQIDLNTDLAICIDHGIFKWLSDQKPTLHSINLRVKEGSLIAVVGRIGSGKSSLISAILGEMNRAAGAVFVKGSVAYVSQQAWIRNATIRENIIFGKEFSFTLYQNVLKACALGPDLDMLPNGDQTEIGEKGVNLSGGQKQRVSLARAVYSNADVYLLDDPLSAVDAHVGRHIFDQVIGRKGMLSKKTCVLVTHALAYLPDVDYIVVMKNGTIAEMGTYADIRRSQQVLEEILQDSQEEYPTGKGIANQQFDNAGDDTFFASSELTMSRSLEGTALVAATSNLAREKRRRRRTHSSERRPLSLSHGVSGSFQDRSLPAMKRLSLKVSRKESERTPLIDKGKLIEDEEAEEGLLSTSVFRTYLKSAGFIPVLVFSITLVSSLACLHASSYWLAQWTDSYSDPVEGRHSTRYYSTLYGVLGICSTLLFFLCVISSSIFGCNVSQQLHDTVLISVFRSPMSFFDKTPLGRIVNRFAKDIYCVDDLLPRFLLLCALVLLQFIGTIVLIMVVIPYFTLGVIPLTFVFVIIQRYYMSSSRQLTRLLAVTRSPVFSQFSETLNGPGASTIRAYGRVDEFISEIDQKIDVNQRCIFYFIAGSRWATVRIELIACLFAFLCAILVVVLRDTTSSGMAGLALSYSLQISTYANSTLLLSTQLESNLVSVERLREYQTLEPEGKTVTAGRHRLDRKWPTRGEIKFQSYSTRYREGLDLVLKNVDCTIKAGEQVGIVGRTGAGKSSITLALFRIIEAAAGTIYIDGVDIADVELQDLRSRITIIPQDPVLFCGTVRNNIDPSERHSDDEVMKALKSAHLMDYVLTLDGGLDAEVAEGGSSFSVGQRQLICLARALLRESRILVLDEATAAVDVDTDELIQKTIQAEFSDCTVLTIAHRLVTIMDSDRVIVMDEGRIVEFDTPGNLVKLNGVFYSMAKQAGLVCPTSE